MLKSTFSGLYLQRCRWQYGSILIHLAIVAFALKSAKSREIPREFKRSSKVIDLGDNRKRICDFLLVIDSNFARISYRFSDIDV